MKVKIKMKKVKKKGRRHYGLTLADIHSIGLTIRQVRKLPVVDFVRAEAEEAERESHAIALAARRLQKNTRFRRDVHRALSNALEQARRSPDDVPPRRRVMSALLPSIAEIAARIGRAAERQTLLKLRSIVRTRKIPT